MDRKQLIVPFSLKASTPEGQIEGYASVFDVADAYGDVVVAGAFKDTLKEWKKRGGMRPKMLLQHDSSNLPIGVWDDMEEDDKGLYVKGTIATRTAKGGEVYELLKLGAIDSLSIGYIPEDSAPGRGENAGKRLLKKIALFEVSLVNFPANAKAKVVSVKAAEGVTTIREYEAFLRDVGGFSQSRARELASCGWKSAEPRDEADAAFVKSLADRLARLRTPAT